MPDNTKIVIDCTTGEVTEVPMTPEEIVAKDALAVSEQQRQAGQQFAVSEDAERLGLVNERAQTDPAFAALAELALGGKGL